MADTLPPLEPSVAHLHDWHQAAHAAGYARRDQYRACDWCGSCHPADLARSIREHGTRLHWADWKYGWPHKAYADGGNPLGIIKFYTVHLLDATPEDKATIEQAMGMAFTFEGEPAARKVSWRPNPLQPSDI